MYHIRILYKVRDLFGNYNIFILAIWGFECYCPCALPLDLQKGDSHGWDMQGLQLQMDPPHHSWHCSAKSAISKKKQTAPHILSYLIPSARLWQPFSHLLKFIWVNKPQKHENSEKFQLPLTICQGPQSLNLLKVILLRSASSKIMRKVKTSGSENKLAWIIFTAASKLLLKPANLLFLAEVSS